MPVCKLAALLEVGGEVMGLDVTFSRCVSEWSEIVGISPYTIYWWIKKRGSEYAERRISEVA
jgi:hypothetical protein